ncbi:unnamed protein product [Paramecium sonneborni]|uniref:B30.2/SPRY domain-containing protein n=1 Tax=Paramecium sonneborni TaxID=65129 RepID=A0A8S1Q361_9CILI|nr:unnamed protein product [Paramecium sonneborni]
MNSEEGYDRSKFINYNSDSFDCAICSCVARNPKECNQCGGIFCGYCIDNWLKKSGGECIFRCPQKLSINPISRALKKIYDDLELKCSNCLKGIKINQFENHEIGCKSIKCKNYDQCGNNLLIENNEKVCDSVCLLFSQVKNDKSKSEIYWHIKQFVQTNGQRPDNYQIDRVLQIVNSSAPIIQNQSIKWDRNRMGAGMELTDGDQKVFLKEQAYMFRTIIANFGFESGIVYWEIEADDRTENELKIGVTTQRDFNYNSAFCDFEYGWAYYGLAQLRHNSNATGPSFGKRFKKEGTLGICLNMNQGTLMFSLNGEFMGCAYKDERLKQGPIYPAVALLHCAGCKITSGKPVPQIFQQ